MSGAEGGRREAAPAAGVGWRRDEELSRRRAAVLPLHGATLSPAEPHGHVLCPPPPAGSIKAGRRSSYLLAITTERSKSCDDGLNTFRDEGKILR